MSTTAAASSAANRASAPSERRVAVLRALAGFALPLYFVLLMAATIVTATHHTQPHDLALTLAGPESSTSTLAAGLDKRSPGAFDITQTTSPQAARAAVLRREAVGAIVLGGSQAAPTVTTYSASAGGRSAASAVQAVGSTVATQLRATPRAVDLVPVLADDTLGTAVFYLILYSGIGGYLTIIVLTQVMPRAKLRVRYGFAAGGAVVAPVLVFGLSSIFVDFGLSFGQAMALLGIDALYVFTVALVVVLADQLLGRAAMFLVAPIAVFVNISSSGGPGPESMLPGFWQAMHSVWFGAGANEAMRDVVSFPGADPLRWILQLLVWTIALLVVTVLLHSAKTVRRLRGVVDQQQHRVEMLSEDLQLMTVTKQPGRQAIRRSGVEPSGAGVPSAIAGPAHPEDRIGDADGTATSGADVAVAETR